MSILTIWIYAIGLQSTGILSYTQHFMSDNVMPWHDADIVCPKLFNPGKGVVHLAGNLTSDPEQIQVLRTLKNQESFWLDGIRYHLGCNEMSCEYLRVQHRIGAKELKAICIKNGLEIESNCNKVYNLTSIADQSNLHTLSEYGNGEELRINQADIKGILKECRLATRTPNGFRIKYQNCAATHKVLCQKHSKVTSIVTTLVYQRTANAVDTEENVYVRMTSTVTEAYDTKGHRQRPDLTMAPTEVSNSAILKTSSWLPIQMTEVKNLRCLSDGWKTWRTQMCYFVFLALH
ncbi:uncharacterized protein LOC125673656 isoform X6 [Ostrea edulis]|uniref:uncharacterized protein LOC125673656 isoform X6 n=1 Tax=Ostrea edulis TaxID=37623 RepID=UPI0024AEADCD|nr:uncharacterized protein LOC125673656 isoform X6 [Ostrea edulis]